MMAERIRDDVAKEIDKARRRSSFVGGVRDPQLGDGDDDALDGSRAKAAALPCPRTCARRWNLRSKPSSAAAVQARGGNRASARPRARAAMGQAVRRPTRLAKAGHRMLDADRAGLDEVKDPRRRVPRRAPAHRPAAWTTNSLTGAEPERSSPSSGRQASAEPRSADRITAPAMGHIRPRRPRRRARAGRGSVAVAAAYVGTQPDGSSVPSPRPAR